MLKIVRNYPALSQLFLAMILGITPLALVNTGLLPQDATQLGALSAGVAGIILAAIEGRDRFGKLLRSFLVWRVKIWWWIFALFFTIIPSVASLYLFSLFSGLVVDWSGLKPLYSVIPTIIMLTIIAGIGEEFGWRGYLLPRLQARHNAFVSSLIVGLMWGIWHIPLFLTSGTTQYAWRMEAGLIIPILGYTLFCMAWSIQYTWVFNNTKGSMLLAAVIHGAGNAWLGNYIDVYRGHFGGIITFMVVTWIVSIIIVRIAGGTNLSRTHKRMSLLPE